MSEIPSTFTAVAVKRIKLSEAMIYRCLDQLTDEQLWYRAADYENSIANLLLHLAGNMRQWILHGIDHQPDVRRRDEEFTLTPTMSAAQARAHFTATLAESCNVIAAVPAERLLELTDPQPGGGWGEVTLIEVILLIAGHLQLHAGQIILLTKQILARDLDLTLPRKR